MMRSMERGRFVGNTLLSLIMLLLMLLLMMLSLFFLLLLGDSMLLLLFLWILEMVLVGVLTLDLVEGDWLADFCCCCCCCCVL